MSERTKVNKSDDLFKELQDDSEVPHVDCIAIKVLLKKQSLSSSQLFFVYLFIYDVHTE